MDVDDVKFWPQLLPILRSISNATFVAIDVEMSGISIGRFGVNDRSRNQGKPSLQQQYEETREAAELYQVLQIGITCVEEDHKHGSYVARPYNFNVSPLIVNGERLDIERDITLSSSAISFLMKNRFDMGAIFTKGVSYLSREEEISARLNYTKRLESAASIPDIIIPSGDEDALKFYENARKTITDWTKQTKGEMDYVNIGYPGGLNGFQRRLVHQLVRSEFPTFRSFARCNGDFMQVEEMDPYKEAQIAKSKLHTFEAGLARQIGIRFIFEALVGGDLSGLDPKWFCVTNTGVPAFKDLGVIKKDMLELQTSLKSKRHILVGHNLFTDLIFIYRTFVGTLPDTVDEFNKLVSALFPQVIDTKYLATQGSGSMRNKSSLKDLCDEVKFSKKPELQLSEDHTDYGAHGKEHEAGYDSWMTAQVFVKLSAKIAAENGDLEVNIKSASLHDINGISSGSPCKILTKNPKSLKSGPLNLNRQTGSCLSTGSRFGQLDVEGLEDDDPSPSPQNGGGGVSLRENVPDEQPNLMDTDIDGGFKIVSAKRPHLRPQTPSASISKSKGMMSATVVDEESCQDWFANLLPQESKPKPHQDEPYWIPNINSSFWKTYMNRLRVYGTETEICHLGVRISK